MSEYLKLKKSNCKNCYKCLRSCPVKSMRFSNTQANIVSEDCILCGHCFLACPQNTKEVRNDLGQAKALLQGNAPVYASLAPSFVANYENATILSLEKALKELGFSGVEETAVGATIVKKHYDENIAKKDITISSCCHTVNLLIQKYYPQALPYLAAILSPMQAHCLDIKRRVQGAKTVFIGPCISKKAEAESYPGYVDCVLTFEELSHWLAEENIKLEYIEDKNKESKARLFPTTGGILKSMAADHPAYTYLAIDSMENCINALKDILNGNLSKCFIEMSACSNSCIGGPAMDKKNSSPVRNYTAVSRYAGSADYQVATYSTNVLAKNIQPLAPRFVHLSDEVIEEVLRKIGKRAPEHELNCGGCGYNTCREKARAVLEGKAHLEMCLPFLNEKSNSFSDHIIQNTPNAIIVLNEVFELQQLNKAACEMMNIKNPRDVIGSLVVNILDPTPFIKAAQQKKDSHQRKVYLPEYNKYVNQTILYDKNYNIIICIMRDVTEEVKQQESKEEIGRTTIEIADKVIEKQLRSVQEIASLLGETAAETKVALTRLKETLRDG